MAQNFIDFTSGFKFENYSRNLYLEKSGLKLPKAVKTGTTICGIVCKDGIVLGADTRATEGDIVADKCCQKIHFIAENIYCCGAGTAADTEMVTRQISAQVELLRMGSGSGRSARVDAAVAALKRMLFRYQGYIGAALVLGGVDCTGPRLVSISPWGNTDELPYMAMGSGSLAALSVLEVAYKPDLTCEDGKRVVRDAIAAGVLNDLGSGSQVDICVIGPDRKANLIRPFEIIAPSGTRNPVYFPRGSTSVASTVVKKVELEVLSESIRKVVPTGADSMDTS